MNRFTKGMLLVQMGVLSVALPQIYAADEPMTESRLSDTTERKLSDGTLRASQLMDLHVFDKDGNRFGQVKDIVLSPTGSKLSFAIVAFEGNDALKDRVVPVPVFMLHFAPSDNKLYTKTTQAAFAQAPNLSVDNWAYEINQDYYTKLWDYVKDRVQNMSPQSKQAFTDAVNKKLEAGGAQPAAAAMTAESAPIANRRVSTIIGRSVQTLGGENIGKINDLVVDSSNGQVIYAVLSYGGMMGMEDKLFAFPLDSFRYQAGSDKLVLEVTKNQLKGMPGFDKENWPKQASQLPRSD
jgi:sporulation protein YlmC with PRC-barrel domain